MQLGNHQLPCEDAMDIALIEKLKPILTDKLALRALPSDTVDELFGLYGLMIARSEPIKTAKFASK